MKAGVGPAMRQWTIVVEREVTPELVPRGDALARWRWGTSARIVASDQVGRTVTFVGPDSDGTAQAFKRSLDLGEVVPEERGMPRSRRKR